MIELWEFYQIAPEVQLVNRVLNNKRAGPAEGTGIWPVAQGATCARGYHIRVKLKIIILVKTLNFSLHRAQSTLGLLMKGCRTTTKIKNSLPVTG